MNRALNRDSSVMFLLLIVFKFLDLIAVFICKNGPAVKAFLISEVILINFIKYFCSFISIIIIEFPGIKSTMNQGNKVGQRITQGIQKVRVPLKSKVKGKTQVQRTK